MEDVHTPYEPMDVDTSGNSVSTMEISYNSDSGKNSPLKTEKEVSVFHDAEDDIFKDDNICKQVQYSNVKRYHIKLERKCYKKDDRISRGLKFCSFAVLVICTSIGVHYYINDKCSNGIDLKYVKEVLSKSLFGQEHAISEIIDALSVDASGKLIFFYGGTGVGKTYAAALILEKLRQSINFYHYTMPNFINTFSSEFMLGFAFCKSSLIVVDDLRPNNINIKPLISDIIEKSESLAKNITVILIFNCDYISENFIKKCDESFLNQLKETFHDVKAAKTFVKFNQLTSKVLMKCIEKELDNTVSVNKLSTILKNFNVALDGCKGVHAKIKFLNID